MHFCYVFFKRNVSWGTCVYVVSPEALSLLWQTLVMTILMLWGGLSQKQQLVRLVRKSKMSNSGRMRSILKWLVNAVKCGLCEWRRFPSVRAEARCEQSKMLRSVPDLFPSLQTNALHLLLWVKTVQASVTKSRVTWSRMVWWEIDDNLVFNSCSQRAIKRTLCCM